MALEPFSIPFAPEMVTDLHRRLDATRWNDAVTGNWMMGTERGFLERLVRFWRESYDWKARVASLNALPHFRGSFDGLGVHFLHFRSGGGGLPLLLMNGWPSSFIEFQRLAPLLTSGSPGFDVVVPTMPGFGFSDRPSRPYQVELSDLYPALMSDLGYDRFMVAGTDIGSGVATRIALRHPHRVLGLHVSSVAPKPGNPEGGPVTPAEIDYEARVALWSREEGAYQALQSTRPQTLAFGLADSPVGLASWIIEKMRG
ncbi:epoxide hydrolase family protein [Brevundimonas sp.]|uniref:epoxide hydrolase family protein n=1 Tax=Brevundimonas sp. TaxID=1871086 RepID=UPI00356220CF